MELIDLKTFNELVDSILAQMPCACTCKNFTFTQDELKLFFEIKDFSPLKINKDTDKYIYGYEIRIYTKEKENYNINIDYPKATYFAMSAYVNFSKMDIAICEFSYYPSYIISTNEIQLASYDNVNYSHKFPTDILLRAITESIRMFKFSLIGNQTEQSNEVKEDAD